MKNWNYNPPSSPKPEPWKPTDWSCPVPSLPLPPPEMSAELALRFITVKQEIEGLIPEVRSQDELDRVMSLITDHMCEEFFKPLPEDENGGEDE